MEKLIEKLQTNATLFLIKTKLLINVLEILPKEIEVYYYKKGVFEDESVHQNELQTKIHKNQFYIHRSGKKRTDNYKGGNRPGMDFIVSDEDHVFYSYLIRSAVINGKLIIGPHKVLEEIKTAGHFDDYSDIESATVEVVSNDISGNVLFSKRINLTKGFVDYKLRAVVCDQWYRESKYPAKEGMIVDFLCENIHNNMDKDIAKEYLKKHLGYVPSSIKQL